MTIAPRMRVLSPKEVCQTCWLAPCEQPGWLSTWLLGWLRLQVRSPGFGDKPRVWRQAAGLETSRGFESAHLAVHKLGVERNPEVLPKVVAGRALQRSAVPLEKTPAPRQSSAQNPRFRHGIQ